MITFFKKNIDLDKLFLITSIVFVVAFIIYSYSYNNYLPAYDAIAITRGTGGAAESGRWFITLFFNYIGRFFGFYQVIPQANLLMGYLLIALSCYCLIKIFEIENKFHIVLISAIYISSPAIADLVAWFYTFHAYCLSLFLASLSVFVLIKVENIFVKYILSFCLIVLSLAIYQAFLPVVTTILICKLILYSYDEKNDNAFLIKITIQYILFVILGVLLYIISCKISLAFLGSEMSGYGGMGNNVAPNYNILKFAITVLKAFAIPFALAYTRYGSVNETLFSKVFIFIYLVLLIYTLFISLFKKDKFRKFFMFLLYISLPISISLFKIMTPGGTAHRTVFSIILVFILPFVLFKEYFNKRVFKVFNVLVFVIAINLMFNDLGSSYNLFKGTKLIENWTNQLVAQVKGTDGYNVDMKVAMVGDPASYDKTVYWKGSDVNTTFNHAGIYNIFFEANYKKQYFFKECANYNYEMPEYVHFDNKDSINYSINTFYVLDDDGKRSLHSTDKRILDMPNYPNSGSIKIIDNVVVVKFSD